MDSISTGYIFDKKELVLPKNKNIKYKLDSAVVRDTQTKHFCALIEIGDDECGFDGVSYRKLSKFNWKQKLGKNENLKVKAEQIIKQGFQDGTNAILL